MASSLKPSQQCKKAARTAQTVLSQLARAFHFRDRHVFLRLYVQYVRPHLEYAVSAWAPWYETDKECLEKVQRRAVNMISGLRATNYEEKLKELGISSLDERRKYLDMLQDIQGDDWEGQRGEVHLVRHGQLWTKSNKTGSGSAEHQAKGG
jgi:hypothetical protein